MELFHHALTMPILSLIAGIIIILVPRVLNYIVALYLIIMGVMGLINYFQ